MKLFFAIIFLIAGIAAILYSRVTSVHDSNLKAMGSSLLKTIARIGGIILILAALLLFYVNSKGMTLI